MKEYTSFSSEQFLKGVKEKNARELVLAAIGAAREHIEYARMLNAARRADILLDQKGAGRVHELAAKKHYQSRNSQLRSTKVLLAKFLEANRESMEKRWEEFTRTDGPKEMAANTKRSMILRLIDSRLSPEETERAAKQLETTLMAVQKLKSVKEIDNYLQQHIDEVLAKKMGNPGSVSGWCLLLLLISSLFMVLYVIALLICILSLGLLCEGILDQMLKNACTSG